MGTRSCLLLRLRKYRVIKACTCATPPSYTHPGFSPAKAYPPFSATSKHYIRPLNGPSTPLVLLVDFSPCCCKQFSTAASRLPVFGYGALPKLAFLRIFLSQLPLESPTRPSLLHYCITSCGWSTLHCLRPSFHLRRLQPLVLFSYSPSRNPHTVPANSIAVA